MCDDVCGQCWRRGQKVGGTDGAPTTKVLRGARRVQPSLCVRQRPPREAPPRKAQSARQMAHRAQTWTGVRDDQCAFNGRSIKAGKLRAPVSFQQGHRARLERPPELRVRDQAQGDETHDVPKHDVGRPLEAAMADEELRSFHFTLQLCTSGSHDVGRAYGPSRPPTAKPLISTRTMSSSPTSAPTPSTSTPTRRRPTSNYRS